MRVRPFRLCFAAVSERLPQLSPAELARYSRHLQLEEIGLEGQRKLAAARVLVVGAGGLGSPAALYLAAAGIGTLGIADFDRVELHNLHRQLLHDDRHLGQPKVDSAASRLRTTNPFIRVVPHPDGVTPQNACALFRDYDVIVDGTDNFAARYLNNDAAVLTDRPLVYGSIYKFEGQVTVFHPAGGGPCYRCLFPEPPAAGTVPGCGEAGVLGALCGIVGSLQALEVIKLVIGVGAPLRGRVLTCNTLAASFSTLALPRAASCPLCGDHRTIRDLESAAAIASACATPAPADAPAEVPFEVSVTDARERRDRAPGRTTIIDVREPYELEICRIEGAQHIPMRQIPQRLAELPTDQHLLIVCHTGGRSSRVTEFLRARGFPLVSNVAGGIDAWAEAIEPGMRRY